MREFRVLNLGAGVQSTALALMSHKRVVPEHVPLFDCAIFSDTGEEPGEVYRHLEWLIAEVKDSFPVHIRSAGKLGDDLMNGQAPSGYSYERPDGKGRFASIPAFTSDTEGVPGGLTRRQCTKEYKTEVINKFLRRELAGIGHGQRMPKDVMIHQYIGLSYDEPGRIFGKGGRPGVKERINSQKWATAHFPLYDMYLTREMLRGWLANYGIPHRVPRSACTFCPFHDNAEWSRLKGMPEEWARIVQIDRALRTDAACGRALDQKLYLHRSCRPIEDVDLTVPEPRPIQQDINFSVLECEGMCGL